MADKKFAAGIFVEKPSPKAPEFVIAKLSFKVAEAVAFLQANENGAGYCNCDVLMAKDGQKYYAALNDYKPNKPESLQEEERPEPPVGYDSHDPDSIPF